VVAAVDGHLQGTGGAGGSGIVIIAFPISFTILWKPTVNPGLALWFDASDNSSVTLNGSTVAQWNDKSPNQYAVIQPSTGNQPTYVLNSLNSFPGLQLSNTAWLYQYGNAMSNYTGSLFYVHCVTKYCELPTNGWSIFNTLWFNTYYGASIYRYHWSLAYTLTPGVTLFANNVNNINTQLGYIGQQIFELIFFFFNFFIHSVLLLDAAPGVICAATSPTVTSVPAGTVIK
jgi:hypothetical protein